MMVHITKQDSLVYLRGFTSTRYSITRTSESPLPLMVTVWHNDVIVGFVHSNAVLFTEHG
jgi:hypothetical protein